MIDHVEKSGEALLVDLNGKIVWKGTLNKGNNKLHLSLDKGIYLLQHQSQQFKLIRQ